MASKHTWTHTLETVVCVCSTGHHSVNQLGWAGLNDRQENNNKENGRGIAPLKNEWRKLTVRSDTHRAKLSLTGKPAATILWVVWKKGIVGSKSTSSQSSQSDPANGAWDNKGAIIIWYAFVHGIFNAQRSTEWTQRPVSLNTAAPREVVPLSSGHLTHNGGAV